MKFSDLSVGLTDPRVAAVRLSGADYHRLESSGEIRDAMSQAARLLDWPDTSTGAFGAVIPPGARVIVKPNLVLHANQGTSGIEPLITNAALIIAVVAEALKASPSCVTVGDAPIQMCDWDVLMERTGLGAWAEELQRAEPRFKGIKDYRRTVCRYDRGIRVADENVRPMDQYVLFDLGEQSLLEPLTSDGSGFRVTSYDPRLMAKTHSPGNHQYLVAAEIVDADVVINLPKLKTHKKAGISSALKNLVGINGNKEYLPHHRVGGSADGGDCYPGRDRMKRLLEYVLDLRNRSTSPSVEKVLYPVSEQLERINRLRGDRIGVEGSWSGNQTVARMTLDLNRILLYGKRDGEMAETVQRRVVHVVDAVVAGQGNGPLASDDLPLGLILMGMNATALDWIGAKLLGYEPERIPLLATAFTDFKWPITRFAPEAVTLLTDDMNDYRFVSGRGPEQIVSHPAGWLDARIEGKRSAAL